MSHLGLSVGKVVPGLLVQHGIAPSKDASRLEEVTGTLELDWELLLAFLLSTCQQAQLGDDWERAFTSPSSELFRGDSGVADTGTMAPLVC